MQTKETDQVAMLEKAKSLLENWDILKLPKEERVAYFSNYLIGKILAITDAQDQVENIVVAESLFEDIDEALGSLTLPDTIKLPEGMTMEQAEQEFKQYCELISIQTVSTDQLAHPDMESRPLEETFIHITTTRMKHRGFLNYWDNSLGITSRLSAMGCPIQPSEGERRMLFLLFHMMSCMDAARAEAAAHHEETKSKVQLFNIGDN